MTPEAVRRADGGVEGAKVPEDDGLPELGQDGGSLSGAAGAQATRA